jgi:gamma-glutamyltranspeptidase
MTIFEFNKNYGNLSLEDYFKKAVELSGKNFEIEESLSGYYRLRLDGKLLIDDPANEDVCALDDAYLYYTQVIVEEYI